MSESVNVGGLGWNLSQCRVGATRSWQKKDGEPQACVKLEFLGGSIEPNVDPDKIMDYKRLYGKIGSAAGPLVHDVNTFGERTTFMLTRLDVK